ncbi:hypothetical protein OOJ91_12925 [Micromonospora lupini]|uniref:hypothetical protein n=1 Tax=Micromonospora lupini TaxID=285679 RepID=UPI00224F6DE6|nr:hypothetical protein [Micromonospora lupini]MCX5066750.1 hypothetical protein [Micromonospora lupini]
MNVLGYLLGLATIPALVGGWWLLRFANQQVRRAVNAVVLRVEPQDGRERARLGAAAACSRRVYMTEAGGVTVAVLLGHDRSQWPELHRVIRQVIAPVRAPRVRAPGERTPHDPGIDYTDQDV